MNRFEGILICTDLDGTLLKGDKSISRENSEAIEYFKAEGGKFTLPIGYFHTRPLWVYEPKHGERIAYNFPFFETHGNKNDYHGHFITKNTVNEVIALLKEVELLAAQKQAQEETKKKAPSIRYLVRWLQEPQFHFGR